MTRRRAVVAGAAALVAAVVLAAVMALSGGRGDGGDDDASAAYAGAWQRACAGLRADAARTVAQVRERTAGDAGRSRAALRAAAADVAGPYLDRTAERLRSVSTASPPERWRRYHEHAVPALRAARARAVDAAALVRRGDVSVLSALDLGGLEGAAASAPADLRRRTPACTGASS